MIFKTFDNNIDKMSAKWGIFGKSFNDIGTAISGKISDINKNFQTTDDLIGSIKNSGDSVWARLYPTKEQIASLEVNVPELIDTTKANEYLDVMKQIDVGIHPVFKSYQDWHDELADGEKWIAKHAQSTQGQIRSLDGVTEANQKARSSALAHNAALKQQTLGAKAASVAMNLLSTAANMLVMYAISKLITAWDDYKEKLREIAQETAEQAEKSSNNVQSLLDLQEKLDDNTASAEDLTTAFREQMRTMGYTEEEIDNLIDKYNGLAGAIKGATEEALNNAKTDAYADMSTSGRSLTVEAKGNTNVGTYYSQNKELSEEIRKMLDESAAILDGGIYRMNKNASAEDIYSYYLTLKDISQLIQETAKRTNDDSLLAGDSLNPTPYYQVSEALDALSESAELYGNAVSRLHNADAQLELSNYLKTNDIDSKEAFDTYVDGIKNNTTYSEAYKQVLLEVANDAFPQFSAAAKDASDSISNFPDEITDSLSITDTVNNINKKLKPALDSLVDTYTTLFSEEGYEWQPINVEEFASIKDQLDSLSEDFGINVPTEDYENFVKILSDSTTTSEQAQQAFDDLASSMINNSNVVQLTDENFDVLRNSLENLGVANATEVLEQMKEIHDNLSEAGIDLANVTIEEAEKFIYLSTATETAKEYLRGYMLEKYHSNQNPLNTLDDIKALEKECEALNITGQYLKTVLKLKTLYESAKHGGIGTELKDEIEIAKAELNDIYNNQYKYKVNFDGNLNKNGAGSSSKSAKDTTKTFDWIETLISRIQRNITNLGKVVSATYRNWSTRNNALAQEMGEVNKEINAQMTAYNAYMQKANGVPLAEGYKELVRSGAYKISEITDEKLKEQIQEYEEWYNKALDASDAIEELRANLAELAKTKFDNISAQYDEQISLITHNVSMLEGFVSQSEAAGYMASEVYYKAMAEKQQENIAQLQGEYSSLLSAFDEAVKNGSIEKYSSDWYDMLGNINDVEQSLQDATTQLVEFNQTLQQLSWEVFDRIRESVNDITTEAEFLIDVLDSKDLHTDKGVITDEGLAVQGLHAVNYNTYMEQAITYAEEMRKIEAEMANDPYDMELVDRRNELLELQQEAIQNSIQEKEAIIDLISDGYDKMLESLQKVIDKNKEALNAEKSLFDYERDIESKTSNIASLRKQLQAYSTDNSEQAKSTIQRLQVSLSEAEKDLQQTEYEKFIDDSQQLLDSLMDDTQEWVNTRLDDIDGLISESIDATNKNAETISSTIKETANSYGYGISDQMETIWDSANDVVCTYGDILKGTNENIANNITNGTTNVVTAINGLNGSMQTMIGKLNEIATANTNSIAQAQNAVVNGQNSSYPTNNSASNATVSTTPTSNTTTKDDKPKVDKSEKVKKWRAVVEGKDIGDRNGYDKESDAQRVIDSEINRIAELKAKNAREKAKKNGVSGSPLEQIYNNTKSSTIMDLKAKNKPQFYASGTSNAKKGWAVVGEEGNEIIIDKDGNAVLTLAPQLLNLKGGEQVINGKETSELLTSNLMPLSADQLWGNIVKTPKLPEMSKGVGGNVTYDVDKVELVLPNVKDYDSLVTEMQHDKRFERIVQSMTTDRLAGKGSLNKYKF